MNEHIDLWVAAIRDTGFFTKKPVLFTRTHINIRNFTTDDPLWQDLEVRYPGLNYASGNKVVTFITPVREEAYWFIYGLKASMTILCQGLRNMAQGEGADYRNGNTGIGYEMATKIEVEQEPDEDD